MTYARNIPNTGSRSCACGPWIDHHYFVTGSRRTTCSVLGCGGPAEVGAHVYWIPSSGAYDGAHYIIPMCHGCNMIKTRDLPVDSRVQFAPANISTCTVYVRERRR